MPKNPPYRRLERTHLSRAIRLSLNALRAREEDLFCVDCNSQLGLRLATVRVEVTRLGAGLPLRVDVLVRALSCVVPPADSPEGAGADQAASAIAEVQRA